MTTLTEADVEHAALAWLSDLVAGSCRCQRPRYIAPDTANAERVRNTGNFRWCMERRLRDALAALNPTLPTSALDVVPNQQADPSRRLDPRSPQPSLDHRMLCLNGVEVEYREARGTGCAETWSASSISTNPPTTTGWPSTDVHRH